MPSHIVQPTDQRTFIDPYSQRLFDMGVQDSRVYLSRQVNFLLETFGSDCVIRGLYINNYSYDPNTNILTVTVDSGRAIVDTTLHIFDSPITVEIDTTPYEDTGYFVVNISYRYIQTIQANRPFIKISYVSAAPGLVQAPEAWSPNRDRLVLAWFSFVKDDITNQIISLEKHDIPDDYIIIDNIKYYPRRGTNLLNGWGASIYEFLAYFGFVLDGGTFFDSEDTYWFTFRAGEF